MCGIVGYIGEQEAYPILIKGLHRLEYRGYDSAGVSMINTKGDLNVYKATGKVAALEEKCANEDTTGSIGIAHTRWATHGEPNTVNAHPHLSQSGNLSLVHNGIIENYKTLRSMLEKKGYEFCSETDTEVLVQFIEYTQKTEKCDLFTAVQRALKSVVGAYAIAILQKDHPDQLVCARKGSPLVIGLGIGENFVASDVLALLPVTRRFIYLDEGEIAILKTDSVKICGLDLKERKHEVAESDLDAESISKGKYRHFMQKEIFEQPEALENTAMGRLASDTADLGSIAGLEPGKLSAISSIKIVACGTSYHAGLVGKYWLEDLAGISTSVEIASEYRYRRAVVRPGTLFITISQSGETADTLACLRLAKTQGYAATLCICNAGSSSLVRESDLSMLTRAGAEIGVASTKAFTTQLLSLLLLTLYLGRANGALTPDQGRSIVDAIKSLPDAARAVLGADDRIKALAGEFAGKHNCLFLGRGIMYPIALEGALKLKEISYIHAEGYAAGELKHGPIALIDEAMPVVVVAPDNALLSKLESNIEEVRARGGRLYVFSQEGSAFREDGQTEILRLPSADPILQPILFTLPLQQLAYHCAVINGTDVDQPRNLAKSVTVE